MTYNWQQHDWPNFRYKLSGVEDTLLAFAERTGRASGLLLGLTADAQTQTAIEMMVVEALTTSSIEGELLSRRDVLSSIRNNLGLAGGATTGDKRAKGVAELMINIRNSFQTPLSEQTLYEWHRMVMAGNRRITAGQWRTHADPMQVVSGPAGHERVHFWAQPSSKVTKELTCFIQWFNATAPGGKQEIRKAAVRTAVTHPILNRSIHLKMAMAASDGPCLKRPSHRGSDDPPY